MVNVLETWGLCEMKVDLKLDRFRRPLNENGIICMSGYAKSNIPCKWLSFWYTLNVAVDSLTMLRIRPFCFAQHRTLSILHIIAAQDISTASKNEWIWYRYSSVEYIMAYQGFAKSFPWPRGSNIISLPTTPISDCSLLHSCPLTHTNPFTVPPTSLMASPLTVPSSYDKSP